MVTLLDILALTALWCFLTECKVASDRLEGRKVDCDAGTCKVTAYDRVYVETGSELWIEEDGTAFLVVKVDMALSHLLYTLSEPTLLYSVDRWDYDVRCWCGESHEDGLDDETGLKVRWKRVVDVGDSGNDCHEGQRGQCYITGEPRGVRLWYLMKYITWRETGWEATFNGLRYVHGMTSAWLDIAVLERSLQISRMRPYMATNGAVKVGLTDFEPFRPGIPDRKIGWYQGGEDEIRTGKEWNVTSIINHKVDIPIDPENEWEPEQGWKNECPPRTLESARIVTKDGYADYVRGGAVGVHKARIKLPYGYREVDVRIDYPYVCWYNRGTCIYTPTLVKTTLRDQDVWVEMADGLLRTPPYSCETTQGKTPITMLIEVKVEGILDTKLGECDGHWKYFDEEEWFFTKDCLIRIDDSIKVVRSGTSLIVHDYQLIQDAKGDMKITVNVYGQTYKMCTSHVGRRIILLLIWSTIAWFTSIGSLLDYTSIITIPMAIIRDPEAAILQIIMYLVTLYWQLYLKDS